MQAIPARYPLPIGSQSFDQASALPGCLYHKPFPLDGNAGGAATTAEIVAASVAARLVSISAKLGGRVDEGVASGPAYITG